MDVYDKTTLNGIFIDEVDYFTYMPRLVRIWATHPHAEVTDIVFKVQMMLVIQKGFVKPVLSGNYAAQLILFLRRRWNRLSSKYVESDSLSSPTRDTRRNSSYRRSKSLPLIAVNSTSSTFTRTNIPSISLTLPSLASPACKFCPGRSHQTLERLLPAWSPYKLSSHSWR